MKDITPQMQEARQTPNRIKRKLHLDALKQENCSTPPSTPCVNPMEQCGFSLPYTKLESTKRQHPASLSNSAMVADTAGQIQWQWSGEAKGFSS